MLMDFKPLLWIMIREKANDFLTETKVKPLVS